MCPSFSKLCPGECQKRAAGSHSNHVLKSTVSPSVWFMASSQVSCHLSEELWKSFEFWASELPGKCSFGRQWRTRWQFRSAKSPNSLCSVFLAYEGQAFTYLLFVLSNLLMVIIFLQSIVKSVSRAQPHRILLYYRFWYSPYRLEYVHQSSVSPFNFHLIKSNEDIFVFITMKWAS